jgi:hypothetical protein
VAVIIDLGEITETEPTPLAGPTRVEVRQRLLASAAAVLILWTLVGSVPAVPRIGEPLWSTQAIPRGFLFGADTAYIVAPDAHLVSGYDPLTGGLRWQVPLDALVQEVIEAQPGVLAVQLGPRFGVIPTDQLGDLAVVLIGPTGRVVARVPGQLYGVFPGGRLLMVQPLPGCQEGDCSQLAVVDPATGVAAWSLPSESHGFFPAQSCQSRTFAVFDGESVQIRALATGELITRLRVLGADSGLLQGGVLYDDELVTAEIVHDGLVLTGIPLAPAAQAWTVTLPQGVTPNGVSGGLFYAGCGGLITAQLANATAVIDRHTGATRATVPGDLYVVPEVGAAALALSTSSSPDGPLSDGTFSPGTGILLALTGPSATATQNVVLVLDAAADGRSASSRAEDGTQLAFYPGSAIQVWDGARGRALLSYEADGRTHFTAVDGRGRLHPLGAVDGTNLTCRARADLLACSAEDHSVRVWRLPPYALP